MNKEKYSKILDQYSDYLKKYGIYLLVILFFLTFSLNYLLGQMKEASVKIEPDSPPPAADVAIENADPQDRPEVVGTENKKEPAKPEVKKSGGNSVQKPEVTPVITPKAEPEEKPATETTATTNTDINSRPPAHWPTGPLNLDWPVRGEVLKNYGLSYSEVYDDYRLHPGIDIKTTPGINITAAYAGKVTSVENNEETKFTIVIDHGEGWTTYYSHLEQVLVKEGQTVKTGAKIGQAGTPGTEEKAAGPHLHFGVKQNDHWVDPLEYLKK